MLSISDITGPIYQPASGKIFAGRFTAYEEHRLTRPVSGPVTTGKRSAFPNSIPLLANYRGLEGPLLIHVDSTVKNFENELIIIGEGLKSSAGQDEKKRTEQLLLAHGYQKIPRRPKTKNKPGPRPKSSNITEAAQVIRIEFLRWIFGLKSREGTKAQVLSVVYNLLSEHQNRCEERLYITRSERAKLARINSKKAATEVHNYLRSDGALGSLFCEPPTRRTLFRMFGSLRLAAVNGWRMDEWYNELAHAFWEVTCHGSEKELIALIEGTMDINHHGPTIEVLVQEIEGLRSKGAPDEEISAHETRIWWLRLHEGFSYNDTLRMATSRIVRMRNLLGYCSSISVDSLVQDLYRLARSISQAAFAGEALPESLTLVSEIFFEATNRQAPSPFPLYFPEDIDIEGPWSPTDGSF